MTDTIEFIVTFPIYKPFRRINTSFQSKLHKTLLQMNPRFRPKYKPTVSELNQFLFSSVVTENIEYLTIEKRVQLEEKVDAIYEKFSNKILKELKKMYSKDPELRNSILAFQDANDSLQLNLDEKISKIRNLPNHVISEVNKIFKNGSLIIWDLPGKEIDRIIAGYEKINREGDSLEEADIGIVSDELALATFGKHHVPCLASEVDRIYTPLSTLKSKIKDFQSKFISLKNPHEKEVLIEIASVFLGKLLGIREPINLADKQLRRYAELEDEIKQEAKTIGSSFLTDMYNKLIERSQIDSACKTIDNITKIITEEAESIRQFLIWIEKLPVNGDSSTGSKEFLIFVLDLYFDLEEFRFITETFQDIPSFTAMGGGIALEGVSTIQETISSDTAIYLKDVFRTFPLTNSTVYALRGVDLEIKSGEFVAIMGPSGSGKTTLLNIMSGLDKPNRGIAIVGGIDLVTAKEKQLTKFRRETVSFIYQSYNLLPVLTNRENVSLPAEFGLSKDLGSKKKRAEGLLNEVGLEYFIKGKPNTLSGGQQQRVTIARSFMNKPKILYCDEPTGDLDSKTGTEIMKVIEGFHKDGVTIVLVTHDENIAKLANRTIRMSDGKIVS